MGADLITHFSRLGSKCTELDAEEKLRIFHDFYRTGEETAFRFDLSQTMRKGHDFKKNINTMFDFKTDCIVPEGMHSGWQTSGTVPCL